MLANFAYIQSLQSAVSRGSYGEMLLRSLFMLNTPFDVCLYRFGTDMSLQYQTKRLKVEIKLSTPNADNRHKAIVNKRGSQSIHDADFLIVLAVYRNNAVIPYIFPRNVVANLQTLSITENGKYAKYANNWRPLLTALLI